MFKLLLFVCIGIASVSGQDNAIIQCDRFHELRRYLNGIDRRIEIAMAAAEIRSVGADENEIEEIENQIIPEPEPEVVEPAILTQREGVVATQSSEGWGGTPDKAIDGNTRSGYSAGSCTHTQNSGISWWKVDLQETSDVGLVRIFNRASWGERLESAVIRVGDSENAEDNVACGDAISTTDIGNGPMIDTRCAVGTRGRYVSVHVANYLTLCEVEVFSSELLSEGHLATQSSEGWGGVPARAVDTSTSGNYNHATCTHTQRQAENWWKLDLGNSFSITNVRIYNRGDCCRDRLNGATIRIGDDAEGMLTNAQCGDAIADADTSQSSIIDRQCSPALDGRYVSVSLPNNYLTLCEVEVWGNGDMTRVEASTETPTGLLSTGKPTAQSSTGWEGYSMRAVDGDYHGRYNDRTCTHTQNDGPSWWRVDLGQSLTVRYVRKKKKVPTATLR